MASSHLDFRVTRSGNVRQVWCQEHRSWCDVVYYGLRETLGWACSGCGGDLVGRIRPRYRRQ